MPAESPSTQRLQVVDVVDVATDIDGVLEAGLDMAYQPIVQLGSGAVIAYEALARPRHPDVPGPLAFFDALEGAGRRLEGERLAVRAAVRGLRGRLGRAKLFVNVRPTTLVDDRFDVHELLELVATYGLAPSDLVVEVTESEAVHDLDALARRRSRLRQLGIGFAVDDAGAGHSSFLVITRLRPSYIKIDRELVAGVDTDGARHALIDAMVRFSRRIGSRLIAEGIETDEELLSLAGLGVDAGQGYYLARPDADELVVPSPASRRTIAAAAQRMRLGAAQLTAGELARPATVVDPAMPVRTAYARFLTDSSLNTLVLVDPDASPQRFTGQVARRSLERYLSSPGAWEQLGQRTVASIAQRQPVTVAESMDIIEVAGIIGARQSQELLDDVVVTDSRGQLGGVVSVRDVLRAVADVRRSGDQDVDPLSGLPGAGWVEAELSIRSEAGEATTIMFVDLDGFRQINDLCGFAAGDDVLRALSRCLSGVAAGVEEAAAAHVGADDFVLLASPRRYEELMSELVRSVESEVMPVVRTLLRLHRAHEEDATVALSAAAVDLAGQPPAGLRYLEWAQSRLSPLIQTAKGHRGHSCVHRSGRTTALSTWSPVSPERRRIALGLAEPSVVRRALDLIDDAWSNWWARAQDSHDGSGDADRFPGPRTVVEHLRQRYSEPLRARAEEAEARGDDVMEVTLDGDEAELLALLDRIALVTRTAYANRRLPVPPELALLDRLLRERARVLTREDRMSQDNAAPVDGGPSR